MSEPAGPDEKMRELFEVIELRYVPRSDFDALRDAVAVLADAVSKTSAVAFGDHAHRHEIDSAVRAVRAILDRLERR